MSKEERCWIDGSKCYHKEGTVSIEACKLCQKVRVARYAIRKDVIPVLEW